MVKETIYLWSTDYEGVRLSSGKAGKQFEEVLSYFMGLPEDDMLYGFRKRAGLPCPGRELGGWYSNDGSFDIYDWDEIFNPFGQWLSFFAKAYRMTQSEEVFGKLKYLVTEWGKTIEADGYFFYSWNNNAYHYSYEKIMTGLLDSLVYAGIEEAGELLYKITQWAKRKLPVFKNMAGVKRNTFTGGEISIKGIDNEWYTLPENLYRAYLETGEEDYKSFAVQWHYDSYWDELHKGNAAICRGLHGYSHVNTLCSAAMAYRVTGNQRYLEIIKAGYALMYRYQVIAGGGYGFDEHLADECGSNYKEVERMPKSFEAACGSYAVLKLSRYLLMFTGDAAYGDWAERVLYNSLFAVLPMKDDEKRRGKTFYYADYRIGGGRKVYYEHSFPCCSGTYPQDLAEYHNMICFYNKEALYISQYLPSHINKQMEGETADLELITDYPEEERILFHFNRKFTRALKLRVPSWIKAESIRITVNGRDETRSVKPDTWLEIKREWRAGDELCLWFPMKLYTMPITPEHPERAALKYGPVLLAAKGRHRRVSASFDAPEKTLVKNREGLEFHSIDGRLCFLPYWEYGEKEWYTVYLDYSE